MYRPRRRCAAEMKTSDDTTDPLTEPSGSMARATNGTYPAMCSRTTAKCLKNYPLAVLGGLPLFFSLKTLLVGDSQPWANMGHVSAGSRRYGAYRRSSLHGKVFVTTSRSTKSSTPMDGSATAIVASHGARH